MLVAATPCSAFMGKGEDSESHRSVMGSSLSSKMGFPLSVNPLRICSAPSSGTRIRMSSLRLTTPRSTSDMTPAMVMILDMEAAQTMVLVVKGAEGADGEIRPAEPW